MDWLHPRNFSKPEKIWIVVYALLIALISTAPYVLFYFLTPPHQQYVWASSLYYDDYFQYYAWAKHIAAGDWLIRNYYTENPDSSFALFNPWFLLLGWTTRLCGNVYFASHALRILAVFAFSYVSYSFLALFLNSGLSRKIAHVLLLGGGLEYPYYFFSVHFFPDFVRLPSPLADPYTFKVLYRYGHLTLALTILLFVMGCYANSTSRDKDSSRKYGIVAYVFFAALMLGFINPYYAVLVLGVVVVCFVYEILCGHKGKMSLTIAICAGCGGALVHYYLQSFTGIASQIAFDDPIGIGDLALYFAPILPWAILGALKFQRLDMNTPAITASSVLIVWCATTLLFVLTPIAFRARLVFGLQFPLIIFVTKYLENNQPFGYTRWPVYALLVIEMLFTGAKENVEYRQAEKGRIDLSLLAAFAFLDSRAQPGDCVFTTSNVGNLLPAYCTAQSYVGHSFQTENFYEKQQLADRFFMNMSDSERLQLLTAIKAKYVLAPPMHESLRAAFALPDWQTVYAESGYLVYEHPLPLHDAFKGK